MKIIKVVGKSIHYHYVTITNHNVTLLHLRDAHHYWRVRNRVSNPKVRTNRYNHILIKRLVESHGLNWTLIHKDYCSITNVVIDKNNFIVACKYHLKKISKGQSVNSKEINKEINEETDNFTQLFNEFVDFKDVNSSDIQPINDQDWDF